jgi:hypothetical protein
MQTVPRCYMQDKWSAVNLVGWWVSELVRGQLGLSHCELLLLEAGSWGWGPFGNPEERPPLEAATKQQLVETVTRVCVCV